MTWDDIKPWISKLAPMVGTALGGPFGAIAGSLVSNALGVKDASPESIKAAITNGTLTGDQIVQLKQAEEQFSLQMAQFNIKSVQDLQALEYQDRANAREREEKTGDSWTPRILAGVVTVGFFAVILYLLKWGLSAQAASAHDIILMLIGALGSAFAQNVMGYYFGGSSDANSHIQAFTKKLGSGE